MSPTTVDRYAWALRYTELGLKVLPAAGKVPSVPWKLYQTEYPLSDELDDWFRRTYPTANLVAVLAQTPFVVVDCDPASASRLLWDRGIDLSAAPQVTTGNNGLHAWFRRPAGVTLLTDKIALLKDGDDQVDFRAEGVIVLPPSIHPKTGREYVWTRELVDRDAVPELPPALVALVTTPQAKAPVLEGPIPLHQRENTLIRILGGARRTGATEDGLYQLAVAENRRCVPPLTDRALRRLAKSASRYDVVEEIEITLGDDPAPAATPAAAVPASRPTSITFHSALELCQAAPEQVDYIVEPYLIAGALTDLSGPPKGGKTTFSRYLIGCALAGTPALDFGAADATPVVVLAEEPTSSLVEGLRAANLASADRLQVATLFDVRGVAWPQVVGAAVEQARRHGARLLVVDTLPGLAGLEGDSENSAGAALAAMKPLQLAAAEGLAVLCVRHHRKGGGDLVEASRGSSAFSGAADVLLSIRPIRGGRPSLRVLDCVGRFRALPPSLTVERIVSIHATGSLEAVAETKTETFRLLEAGESLDDLDSDVASLLLVRQALPTAETAALTFDAVRLASGVAESSVRRALDLLAQRGELGRLGRGGKGHPYRFYLHHGSISSRGVNGDKTADDAAGVSRGPPAPG